jgi:hypothetical protein
MFRIHSIEAIPVFSPSDMYLRPKKKLKYIIVPVYYIPPEIRRIKYEMSQPLEKTQKIRLK